MGDTSKINSAHSVGTSNFPPEVSPLRQANQGPDNGEQIGDIDDYGLHPIPLGHNPNDDSSIQLDVGNADEPQDVADAAVPQRLLDDDYRQLYELMKKAARSSVRNVTFHDVEDYASEILKDPVQSKALKTLCGNVASTMAVLDKLRGEELFTHKLFKGYVVNPAVTAAIDAQLALADAIRVLEHNCNADDEETLDTLALLRNRCEMRATEISRLAGEMRMYAEAKADSKTAEPRLAQTVKAMLPEMAAKMHGTHDAIRHLEAFVAPLLVRLKNFENSDAQVRQTDLDSMKLEIRHMLQALEYAKKNGVDFGLDYTSRGGVVTGHGAANGRVFVDGELLDAMKGYLNDKLTTLGQCRKRIGLKMMQNFALSMMKKSPFEDLFKKALDPATLSPAEYPALSTLSKNHQTYQALRGAILDFFRTPTREKMETLRNVRRNTVWLTGGLATLIKELRKCGKNLSSEQNRDNLESLIMRLENGQLNQFFKHHNSIERISDHLLTMFDQIEAQSDADFQKLLKKSDLVAIFQDTQMFSAVLEARIHGAQDGDANPDYSSGKLVSNEPLGHGVFNTVEKCTFRRDDGTTSVGIFKEEINSRNGLESIGGSVFAHYESSQQSVNLNIASAENASLFGVGNVIAKTSVGVLMGKYGFYMEQAPGFSPYTLQEAGTPSKGYDGLSLKQIRSLNKADLRKLKGNLCRELSNLQWMDIINGQSDRHGDNYFVHFRDDLTVKVTGIDNDASFPTGRTGVGVFTLDNSSTAGYVIYQMFCEAMHKVQGLFSTPDKMLEDMMNAKCVKFDIDRNNGEKNVRITRIDVNKCPADKPAMRSVLSHLLFEIGIKSIVFPSVIDQRLKDKFMEMYNSPEKQLAWETRLKQRMSDEAVAATLARFKDVCQHIQTMAPQDIIQSDEEWQARDWKTKKTTQYAETRESNYINQDIFDRDFSFLF